MTLPSEMEDCGARPAVPDAVEIDPKPGADYMAALADWGDGCRARLRGVVGIVKTSRDEGSGRR